MNPLDLAFEAGRSVNVAERGILPARRENGKVLLHRGMDPAIFRVDLKRRLQPGLLENAIHEFVREEALAAAPMIPGLRYVPGYLDSGGHDALLAAVDAGAWRDFGGRRGQIYGYSYHHTKGGSR